MAHKRACVGAGGKADKFLSYAGNVLEALKAAGIRVEMDTRDDKLGYKIREAQLDKVPFMIIVGEKEQAANTVSVRLRDGDAVRKGDEAGRHEESEESRREIPNHGEMKIEELINLVKSSD